MKKQSDKKCFVISPIGEEGTPTRDRSDKVFRHIITPSVELHGYKPIRADKISEPGMITSQIIQNIIESDLIVADLSERNPNVFYELAIRHAIKMPVIQLIQKGESIPFDISDTRIIHFDICDLDSVENAKTNIISQLETIESGKIEFENPISMSLNLKSLGESDDPLKKTLSDLVNEIIELRKSISIQEKQIDRPRMSVWVQGDFGRGYTGSNLSFFFALECIEKTLKESHAILNMLNADELSDDQTVKQRYAILYAEEIIKCMKTKFHGW